MIRVLESIKDHFELDWKQFGVVLFAGIVIVAIVGTIILLELLWRIQIWKWLLS